MLGINHGNVNRLALGGVLAVALILRLLMFPHRDEVRDMDEVGYIEGSLALLEGLAPGYKAAPAGPNFWVGWAYAGGVAVWHFVDPGDEEKAVPFQVRPFVAVNHALFDLYRNLIPLHQLWIISQMFLTLWATSAAFRLGLARGALAGALLIGGFLAVLPLYVDFTDMSRPYMTSWAFGVLSLHAAACRKERSRIVPAGILLGLAIASRVEMVLLTPVVLWEFWNRPEPRRLLDTWGRTIATSAITAEMIAPWLTTHLIGNLRTIATVRLGPNPHGATTLVGLLGELAWHQGLAGAMLFLLFGTVAIVIPALRLTISGASQNWKVRARIAVLAIYLGMLLLSLGHGTVFLHQQGPVVLALITFSALGTAVLTNILPNQAPWIVLAILLIPLGQTVSRINQYRKAYAPDLATAWVEAHVPPGTRLYLQPRLQYPLPTAEASAQMWGEITSDAAWRKKFQTGLERFGLMAQDIPRALSDENMVQERGNRRNMFILGGRLNLPAPRFDIRLFNLSPVFDPQNIGEIFAKTGGVVITNAGPGSGLGMPVIQWVNSYGAGCFVYCSPDVVALLKP